MVITRASWCNSTGSKLKQHDNVLMQNWNVIQLNLISFLHLVAPTERFLYGCYWDPTPERKVPWGCGLGTMQSILTKSYTISLQTFPVMFLKCVTLYITNVDPLYHIVAATKWTPFRRRQLQMYFLECKFRLRLHWNLFLRVKLRIF